MTQLQTTLSKRMGIAHPVFGFSHSAAIVAAICRAGGFGVLGATRHTPDGMPEDNIRPATSTAIAARKPHHEPHAARR